MNFTKILLIGASLVFSLTSFAYSQVECKSRYAENDKYFVAQIDRYSPSAPFTNIRILGIDHGTQTYSKNKMVSLITPSANFYEYRYWGDGVDLIVDTFPDNAPRPGNLYHATFSDSDLFDGMKFTDISCEYYY